MNIFYKLHLKVEELFGGMFEKHGRLIARHPWKVIIFVVIVDIGFGIGLLKLERDNSIEQYAPKDSVATKHRKLVYQMFDVDTYNNFYQHSLTSFGLYATVIVQRKDGGNMVDSALWSDLEALRNYIAVTSTTTGLNYYSLCASRFGKCVISGEYILGDDFVRHLNSGNITFPTFITAGETHYIKDTFAEAKSTGNFLTSATAVKFVFHLAEYSESYDWNDAFLTRIKAYKSDIFKLVYAHSGSLDEELYANITSDITFFAITFGLMICFAGLVLFGGDPVSNRFILGMAGVVSTGLAIVAAFGFVCLCGVLFASIVGTMPFLIIGIGVDDMFILLSGLADTAHIEDIETRIGKTMRTSGIAITITSLTDVIAFCAGASSVFPAVKHFSLFTGTAILFCYLNYVTFFLSCMTLNEKRISQRKHFFTFRKIKSKEDMMKTGKSKATIFCCGGSPPKHRDDIEGPLEKYPKRLVKQIVLFTPAKIIILILLAAFVGVSVYGAVNFQEGLSLKDLVTSDSYFYSYQEIETTLYDQSISIGLYVQTGVDYRSDETLRYINTLRDVVRNDSDIKDTVFISWLHSYINSLHFDNSSYFNFTSGVTNFLFTDEGNMYTNDVTISDGIISASRFYVLTESIVSSTRQGKMMLRLRDIVEKSPLPVFPYSPLFIFMEQFVAIYSQTLQTLGICVGVVFFITTIFLPLPIMIFFITMTVVFIMVSVVGFMHFWGLTLSSVTMIHIIMCIGFCVDFATHICHAFVQAEGGNRNERVGLALDRAGGPILNGGLSTIIGVIMLALSKSFIFFSFFKVMFMVMTFGLIYSMFLLPVLLSFIGPSYHLQKRTDGRVHKNDDLEKENTKGIELRDSQQEKEKKVQESNKVLVPSENGFPGMNSELTINKTKKKRKKKKRKHRRHTGDDLVTGTDYNHSIKTSVLPPISTYDESPHITNQAFTSDLPEV